MRDRVAEALGAARRREVRVIANTVGGGFGGKLDAGARAYAALLARRAGRPVKLVYTRGEEFVARHDARERVVRIRSAVDRATATIVAQEASVLMDAGAYAGETPAIAAVAMLDPAARPTASRTSATASARVYTNTPPTGAFRGVCGAVLVFAVERHMDNLAGALGVDRRELRLRNVYRDGDRFPNGQELPDAAFVDALRAHRGGRAVGELTATRPPRHGVGIAATSWLTNPLAGAATVKLNEDGTVGLVTAATDIGTGAVATGRRADPRRGAGRRGRGRHRARRRTPTPPPFDGGAQGSRTVFNVGNAVRARPPRRARAGARATPRT